MIQDADFLPADSEEAVPAAAWLGVTMRGDRVLFDDHDRALLWTRGNVPCTLTPLYPHRPSVRDGELARLRAERDALEAELSAHGLGGAREGAA